MKGNCRKNETGLEKIVAASTAVLASANCISWTGSIAGAEEYDLPMLTADGSGVAINATNFPDDNLREKVTEFDNNGDGFLTPEELEYQSLNIEGIGSDGNAVTFNPKGLELLSGIDQISFSECNIKGNLDLSSAPSSCAYIDIYSTIISGNFTLGNCSLSELYLTESVFNSFNYGSSRIGNLFVNGCGKMTSFTVGPNVSVVDISSNDSLTSIDFKSASSLEILTCVDNYSLKSLDLTGASALIDADLTGNALTSLNVRKNTNLESLNIQYNYFTSFDLSQCPQVTHIYFGGNEFTSIDLTKLKNVYGLGVAGMGLTSLDQYKQYFSQLDVLDCSNNALTELDLKKLPLLNVLNCRENMIGELDLSAAPNMERLYARGNRLTKLDISELKKLYYLEAEENLITSLDASNCPKLYTIRLNHNPLSDIKLPELASKSFSLYAEYTALKKIDASSINAVSINAEGTALTDIKIGKTVRVRGTHGVFIGDSDHVDISKLHTDFDYNKVSKVTNGTVSTDGIFTFDSSSKSNVGTYRYEDAYNIISIYRGTLNEPDISGAKFTASQKSDKIFKISAETGKIKDLTYGYICFENADTGEVIKRYFFEDYMLERYAYCNIGNYDCSRVKVYLAACNNICGTEKWTYSEPQYFITGKLSGPKNVKATASDSQVTVSWDATAGAEMYRVYTFLNGTYTRAYSGDAKSTSAVITGLINGTRYGFVVSAKINGIWTDYTVADDLVYATPVASKPAIVGYKAGDCKVKLEWKALSGAEMYRVYYYLNGKYTRAFTADGSRTIATVSGLTGGTRYGFVVSAKVNGAWTAYNDPADLVYVTPTGTPKPTIVGYKVGENKVKLQWNEVPGAEMYRVYYLLNGKYTRVFTTDGSRTIATVSGLSGGTEYGFVVSAKVNGAWTSYNDAADLVYATPTGTAKPFIIGCKPGDGKVKLEWQAVPDAEMYRVYYYLNGKYTRAFTTDGSRTIATVSGLTNGTEYSFIVSAKVNGAWTDYTNSSEFVLATPNA